MYHNPTMSAPSTDCPVERNLPSQGLPWRRWFNNLMYGTAFAVIATGALLWALGYRVNRVAGSIEQTGLLELYSPQAGLNPQVYINGVLQEESLPLTLRWLFPGRYDVRVSKQGYQTWEKQVVIRKNQRETFPGILLSYSEPKPIQPPQLRIDELVNRRIDNKNLTVKSDNELWVGDVFITRTSADILNPEWYLDDTHVIYQTGNQLILRDLTANTTQVLATFQTEAPVPFVIRESGRVLVYAETEELKAFELYQAISLIDRFGVSR